VPTLVYSTFAVRMAENPDLLAGDTEIAPFMPPPGSFDWMIELAEPQRARWKDFGRWARQATGRLARAGVTIGTGSDIWQIPTTVHMEMEELVGAGLSPLQAIHAATGGAARILGAAQDLGTIEPGKLADLVLLEADPVADIRNTRRIRAVVQSGHVVDREAILARFGGKGRRP
jgi:imidazolonepropionase-like amidohydrolase